MCLNEIRNYEVYTGKSRNQEVTQFRSAARDFVMRDFIG